MLIFSLLFKPQFPESGISILQLFPMSLNYRIYNADKPQTQHPHLPLRYEALLSCEFISEALFLLIIFRHSSPHDLIQVMVFGRLFQPSSPPLPTTVQDQEGPKLNNRGTFYSRYAQLLTACSSNWQSLSAFSECLFISKTPKPFQEEQEHLILSSFFCRSKMHNDISNAVAKWLSLLTIYTATEEFAEELSCHSILPTSITVIL